MRMKSHQGWYDVELSELGIRQSLELWEKISDRGIDVVFCSDLDRAIHSAELTFGGKIPIIQDARLRECNYSQYNAMASSIVEPMQEFNIRERFPGGESYEDVKSRIIEFLYFLKEEYQGKSIAILAHKAPQIALDVLLKGYSWEEAFATDWRKKKAWKPGWNYTLDEI